MATAGADLSHLATWFDQALDAKTTENILARTSGCGG